MVVFVFMPGSWDMAWQTRHVIRQANGRLLYTIWG